MRNIKKFFAVSALAALPVLSGAQEAPGVTTQTKLGPKTIACDGVLTYKGQPYFTCEFGINADPYPTKGTCPANSIEDIEDFVNTLESKRVQKLLTIQKGFLSHYASQHGECLVQDFKFILGAIKSKPENNWANASNEKKVQLIEEATRFMRKSVYKGPVETLADVQKMIEAFNNTDCQLARTLNQCLATGQMPSFN